jgi:hypothetical protein
MGDCFMVLSERLNITQVCTLDQRDFSIFAPGIAIISKFWRKFSPS